MTPQAVDDEGNTIEPDPPLDETVNLNADASAQFYEQAQATLVPGGWDELAAPITKDTWRQRAAAAEAKLQGADREKAFALARQALRASAAVQAAEEAEAKATACQQQSRQGGSGGGRKAPTGATLRRSLIM